MPRSYENIENAEESPYLDDFDDSLSDSSFENEAVNPNVQVNSPNMSTGPFPAQFTSTPLTEGSRTTVFGSLFSFV